MKKWEWQLLEDKAPLDVIHLEGGGQLRRGDRVRLRPRAGGDVMDLALAGKTAVLESIEQDYEGKIQLSVVVDDDPGADIGNMRQPGHRFFFHPEEVEPIDAGQTAAIGPRILIAGIGNIFWGDDGFGVEVATRMTKDDLPTAAQVIDFGIRSYDLAFALSSGRFDAAILVDASARGGAPGTLYVIEPGKEQREELAPANAHTMNPESVLRMARTLGQVPKQILVVACEPESLGGEDGRMGLSKSVEAAVDRAVGLVKSLAKRIAAGEQIKEEKNECK